MKIAQSGDEPGKGAVQPGLVGGVVGFLVTVQVAGGFIEELAGGVKLGPCGVLERAGVDDDERAAAGGEGCG